MFKVKIYDLILDLELSLLTSEVRQSIEKLNHLISDDFIEIGSSGKIWNKKDILQDLPNEVSSNNAVIIDYNIQKIADKTIMIIYTLQETEKLTRRTSIWQENDCKKYQMIFHQGTIIIE